MNGLHKTTIDRGVIERLTVVGTDRDKKFNVACYKKGVVCIYVPIQWARKNLLDSVEDSAGEPISMTLNSEVQFREGQIEAINAIHHGLLDKYGGIAELHTGFGKTLVSLCLASRLGRKTLVICHKEDLLHQWADSANKFFGVKTGWIQGDRLECDAPIVVATVQTLYSRKDSFPKDFFAQFGFTIFDEGHRFSCPTFMEVACLLPSRYKLGMSATFRRSDNLEPVWRHFLGDVLYSCSKKAQGGIFYQPITETYGLYDSFFKLRGSGKINHSKYITAITQSTPRNKRLAATVDYLVNQGRKVLVLSDRVEHLEELKRLIKAKSGMYVGSINKKKVPIEVLKENAKCPVVLGTSGKIAEGSDIPDLDTLVICTPKGDVEQLIGRITREHPDKQVPYIVDPVLDTPYNKALAFKRERFYYQLGFKKRTSL